MMKNFLNLAIAAVAVAALPNAAQAGNATTTSTVTLNVVDQCSITAKNVNLGTFSASDTWDTVAARLGKWTRGVGEWVPGSLGVEYIDFGSIKCATGTPYTFTIKGTDTLGEVKLAIGGKIATLSPYVKKFNGVNIPDQPSAVPGAGQRIYYDPLAGRGTGTDQQILGNMHLQFNVPNRAAPTDMLSAAGNYSDTLTYNLIF